MRRVDLSLLSILLTLLWLLSTKPETRAGRASSRRQGHQRPVICLDIVRAFLLYPMPPDSTAPAPSTAACPVRWMTRDSSIGSWPWRGRPGRYVPVGCRRSRDRSKPPGPLPPFGKKSTASSKWAAAWSTIPMPWRTRRFTLAGHYGGIFRRYGMVVYRRGNAASPCIY